MLKIFFTVILIMMIINHFFPPKDEAQIETDTDLQSYKPSIVDAPNFDRYLQRTLGLILQSTRFDFHNGLKENYYERSISLKLTKENLEFLYSVNNLDRLNSSTLRQVDSVLRDALYVSYSNLFHRKQFFELTSCALVDKHLMPLMILTGIMKLTEYCYKNNTPLFKLIKYGCFALFILSHYLIHLDEVKFVLTYRSLFCIIHISNIIRMRLYLRKRLSYSTAFGLKILLKLGLVLDGRQLDDKRILFESQFLVNIEVEKVQSGCLKLSDYFWDWSGGENKCRHEIVLWRVIEKMFRALIVIPLGIIGSGLGKFAGNLFYDLPWGFNIIMWPIMLIVSLVIFFYLTAILLGRSMSFSSFFLFGSKIGGKSKDDNESQVVYELRKQIVDLTERLNNVKITDTDEPVLQLTKNDFKEIVSNLQNRNKSSHDEIENVKEENIGEGIQSIEERLVIKKNE